MTTSSSDSQFVMGYPSMNNNNNLHSQASPSPLTGYAQQLQQPGAYAPAQPPYHSYPGGTLGSKNYNGSQSFNVWYNSRNYGSMGLGPAEDEGSRKFGRVMLVTTVSLIISMCMVSLVIWFLFGTEIPEFTVGSFTVSNLNVTDSMITANWDVNVTVFNPNTDLKVNFSNVMAAIFYKNFPLSISAIEPCYLQGTRLHDFQIRLDNEKAIGKPRLVEEINKGKSGGILYLSARMSLGAKFQSNSVWRKETLRVFCENLKVSFAPTGGNGTLTGDSLTDCLIFT